MNNTTFANDIVPSNTALGPAWDYVQQTNYITGTIITPIVCIFGILGNVFSLFVLSKLKKRSSTYFLIALAVSDLLLLLVAVPLFAGLDPARRTDPSYQIFQRYYLIVRYVLSNVFITTTSWLTVAVTIERFIAVRFSMNAKLLCTHFRAKAAIAGIFIASAAFHVSKIFEYRPNTDLSNPRALMLTGLGQNRAYQTYLYSVNITLAVIIPVLVLIVINVMLVYTLVRLKRSSSMRKTGSQREMVQITVIVILLVCVFLLCHAQGVYLAISIAIKGRQAIMSVPLNMALIYVNNTLVMVNSSVNFLLYMLISQRFRKMAYHLFCNRGCLGNKTVEITKNRREADDSDSSNEETKEHLTVI